ncbi:MAG: DUF2062 domain-containing protein [Proteobacteria bacterium]|nr:DUF2062 domain-containing protein [Pseudomonadota bacterium]
MIEGFIKISRRIWRESIAKLTVILIKPVLHALHPPEYTARAVGVGLFVAFTPTFGIQIPIVFLLWTTAKVVKGDLTFNPVLAMAWTLFTNVLTVAPLYYLFVQTGRLMLGHWEHIQSYDSYLPRFEQTAYTDTGWIEGMWIHAISLLAEFGVPLFVGSLPWAIGIGICGYLWSLRLVRRHRASVARKQH